MTRFDGPPARPLRQAQIDDGLGRIMPQARSIETDDYRPADGSFRAEVVLPSRAGEARVVIRRYAVDVGAPEDEPRRERCSMSGEIMWGWYVDYDEREISHEEVLVLVARPLAKDPVLSYPRKLDSP